MDTFEVIIRKGPLHDELDPIKKSKVQVLLYLWKSMVLLSHVSTSMHLKFGVLQPNDDSQVY